MASRTRDIPPGKEKRGTSPSNLPNTTRTTTQQRGGSPNPPKKTNSPARTHDPTASEKPVPNYLKPTLSSGPDVSKQQGKKPVSKTETTQKPTLIRRRSFDKPPSSTSQSQRSRVSPSPSLRSSSSFSGKTVSPQKGVPDKNSKTPKDAGKQHTLYARPVNTAKKGGIYIKKQEIGDDSLTVKEKHNVPPKKVDNVNIIDVLEPEVKFEDQELSVVQGEEQTVQNGGDIEKGDKDSFLEDQEPISYEQAEGEIHGKDIAKIDVNLGSLIVSEQNKGASENKDAKIVNFESSTILEHQEPDKIEETEGKSENKDAKIVTAKGPSTISKVAKDSLVDDQEPINIKQTEGDSKNTDAKIVNFESPENLEQIETVKPSEVSENQDVSLGVITDTKQEEDTINEMNDIINTDQSVAGNISEEVEERKREEEAHETKEKEVQEVIVEKKPEVVNAVPKVQMTHGKKEIAVSNDVIEETASKLREQRKNKVKALAGAFETVISLQDPK